jgi:ABC-type sugar transport system substrate-binding protein
MFRETKIMRRFIAAIGVAASLMASTAAWAEEKIPVAMSFGGSTIALWNDILAIMGPELDKKGFRLITHDPQFKVEQQVQDWKAWIAQGEVKAIMGWPINADAMVPVTQAAKDAGIPVIGYAVAWKGVAASMLTNPEGDGRAVAAYAVDWIKKTYGDKPVKVAIMSDEQNDLTRLRVEGINNELTEKVPTATVMRVPALTREDGYNAAKQQLTAHPDTTVWLSFSNDNMKGVYKALMDSGVAKDDPNYFLAAMDVTNEDLDLIQIPNSIYRMAFAFRSETLADANMTLLMGAAKGEPVKDIFVAPELVTPETAKNFYVGNVKH